MSKQNLLIGNAVDDGTGDYLRKGGQKINANFNLLFDDLGDGVVPHPAGAWKSITAETTTEFNAEFGKAYVVNTTRAQVRVNLPKGTVADYGKVIRLRDVYTSWRFNPVVVIPAKGDTVKGKSGARSLRVNLMDVELVYCSPGRWEFLENKQVNKISNPDMATVAKKEFIATEGQRDFINVFDDNEYNKTAVEVYHRGNLLYFGNAFNELSDYGSPGEGDALKALDGKSIRLKEGCKAGDVITVITYLDGVAQFRSSYNRLSVRVLDKAKTNNETVVGSRLVLDLTDNDAATAVAFEEFGYEEALGMLNPNTLEVYINGTVLQEVGTADMPRFYCEDAIADTEEECKSIGGKWAESFKDYYVALDDENKPIGIVFGRKLKHGDIVSIRWYNNDIGTLLQMEDIEETLDLKYIGQGADVNITGDITLTDYNNIGPRTIQRVEQYSTPISDSNQLFNLIYPVGTIYENALNPNNPETYMGFGTWILWGEGRTIVGWSNDNASPFSLNNNDIDSDGNPSKTAGRTGGNATMTLTSANIPTVTTDKQVLVVDKQGPVVVGGCQYDPEVEGPVYTKYREEAATVNRANQPAKAFDNMPPYITVYRWMRIA